MAGCRRSRVIAHPASVSFLLTAGWADSTSLLDSARPVRDNRVRCFSRASCERGRKGGQTPIGGD
jgi:hypothetical protein